MHINLSKKQFCIFLCLCLVQLISYAENDLVYVKASEGNPSTAFREKVATQNYFIDVAVKDAFYIIDKFRKEERKGFHLFSHGKPGELLINGEWLNAAQIANRLKNQYNLSQYKHLNIYGCEFAKGEKGKAAVAFLEKRLGLSISASDDVTGSAGDWELEVGNSYIDFDLTDYPYNLQGYTECASQINYSRLDNDFVAKVKDGYTYFTYSERFSAGGASASPVISGTNVSAGNDFYALYVGVYDSNCNQILGTYINHSGNSSSTERPKSIDIDADGNIWIHGEADDSNNGGLFPTTDGSTNIPNLTMGFSLKLSLTGNILFSTLYNNSGTEDNGIFLSGIDGNEVFTAGYNNAQIPGQFAFEKQPYIRRYDTNGNLIYSTSINGNLNEEISDLVSLSNGNLLVVGETVSPDFPTTDGSTVNQATSFVSLLDPTGNLIFSTLIEGGTKLRAIDTGNEIYVTGTSSGAFQASDGSSGTGLFIRRYDYSGNILQSTLIPGNAGTVRDLIQEGNDFYIGMAGPNISLPLVNGLPKNSFFDSYIVRLDNNNEIVYSTYFESNPVYVGGLEVNSAGEAYLTGFTINGGVPTTDGTEGRGHYFAKFNSDGSLCAAGIINTSSFTGIDAMNPYSDNIMVDGDTVYTMVQFSTGYSTDGTTAQNSISDSGDPTMIKFVLCAEPTPVNSVVLSPATQTVCENSNVDQIVGEGQFIDGDFPIIYRDGLPTDPTPPEYSYQWQLATSATGPWTNIPGSLAKLRNYSPSPSVTDRYFRRVTSYNECCGGGELAVSSVVEVLIDPNPAPVVDAGGTHYTCPGPGSPLSIGGSPSASGGLPPYTYSWNEGDYTDSNPDIDPTANAIYTLEITDANGCSQVDQAAVSVFSANAGENTDVCEGEATVIGGGAVPGLTIVPSGGTPPSGQYSVSYSWLPATDLSCTDCPFPTATPSTETTYTLTQTIYHADGTSCSTTDEVNVGVRTSPVSALTVPDQVICIGEEIELGTNPAPINETSISSVSGGGASISNLTDGDLTTGGTVTSGFIEIDLGSVESVNQFTMARIPGAGGFFGESFSVAVSADGVNFNTVATQNNISNTELSTILFNAQDVQYVRISPSGFFGTASVSEFEAKLDYVYIWTPGDYITTNGASAVFDAGNLDIPSPNPITYTISASLGTCSWYEQVSVYVIEARAHGQAPVDQCGPTLIGAGDRTPHIEESYSWRIIEENNTGQSQFLGNINSDVVPVSGTDSGLTPYELEATFTLPNGNSATCYDTINIVPCGCVMNYTVTGGNCADFDLGEVEIQANVYLGSNSIIRNDEFDWSWSPQEGLTNYDTPLVQLTDNVTRTYTVTATSQIDPTVSCTMEVPVNSPSFSTPTINPQGGSVCKGESVNIGDPSTNPGLAYSWSNPDLLDDPTSNFPLASPLTTTDFTVTVTDIATGCRATEDVTVLVAPSANAGEDLLVCDNGTVTIGGNVLSDNLIYSWEPVGADWRNGTGPTDAQPEVFVAIDQEFYLTATDQSGSCLTRDTVSINVEPTPPDFTLPAIDFCPSQTEPIILGTDSGTTGGNNLVPDGFLYDWRPASLLNDPTIQNPTLNTPLPQSSFTFDVVVSEPAGCNVRVSQTINSPVSPPLVTNVSKSCVNTPLTIGSDENPTGAGISYSWLPVDDLNNPTSPNPVFTPTSTGNYSFTVTKTEGGCSTEAVVTITVISVSAPTYAPQIICEGETVYLSSAGGSNSVSSYEWSPTTGLDNPYIKNPTFIGSTTTQYTITVSNSVGCTDNTRTTVTVNPAPAITISLPDTSVCVGTVTSITLPASLDPSTGFYAYRWSPSSFLSNSFELNPEFFLPSSGNYQYTLEVIDQGTGCGVSEDITVAAYVEPPIMNESLIECNNNGTPSEPSDDYISFSLNPTGSNLGTSYSLEVDNGATVTLASGGAATNVSYGNTTAFRLQSGSADGTTAFTVTLRDDTDGECPTTLVLSENSCSSTCDLTNTGLDNEMCADNGTIENASDDYITFSLNPTGLNLGSTYTVTSDNGGVVSLTAGGAASGISYGTGTTFRLQNGSADGTTTYTLTISDDTNVACQITTTVLQNSCGTANYSLGNRVFLDADNNGIQDGTETGIDGVQLRLLTAAGSPYDSDDMTPGVQSLTVTTGNGGYYRFDGLPAGDYIVEVLSSNFTSGSGVLENLESSTGAAQEVSPNVDGDLNDNGLDILVAGSVRSGVVTLGGTEPSGESEPSNYAGGSTTGTAAADTESNLTVDFGFYAPRREDYPDYEDPNNPCDDLPCHTVSTDIYFGSGVTNDNTGSGDNTASSDIDDGVFISPRFDAAPGNTIRFPVSVYNNTGNDAYIRAWIDWSGDGDFEDAGELVYDNLNSGTGTFTLIVPVIVPLDATLNQDLPMRWRLSTDDTNTSGPCGTGTCAADGEIEDYLLRFNCPIPICPGVDINVLSN